MNKFLAALVSIFIAGCVTTGKTPKVPVPKSFIIKSSTIQILGPMDENSTNTVLEELRLRPKEEVTELYFFAGLGATKVVEELINEVKSRKTVCYAHVVTDFMVPVYQACSVRLINEFSVMSRSSYQVLREQLPELTAVINRIEMDEVRATGKSKKQINDEILAVLANPEYEGGYPLNKLPGYDLLPLGCDPVESEMTLTRMVPINDQLMPLTAEVTICPLTRRLGRLYITDKVNKVQALIDNRIKQSAFSQVFGIPLDSVEMDEEEPEEKAPI